MEHVKIDTLILGAGSVGMVAAHALQNAKEKPFLLDRRDWIASNLVDNQVLGSQYLWQPIPGLDCQQFRVLTHVDGQPATPAAVGRYKNKVLRAGDQHTWPLQFTVERPGWRGLRAASSARTVFGVSLRGVEPENRRILAVVGGTPVVFEYRKLISTIPLPSLLALVPAMNYAFRSKPIYVVRKDETIHEEMVRISFGLSADDIYMNYIGNPSSPWTRITFWGRFSFAESLDPNVEGNPVALKPGKIWAHPDTPEIAKHLEAHDIYLLGRYGAWQPEELLHESYKTACQWAGSWWRKEAGYV
jgi:hypothetical protein